MQTIQQKKTGNAGLYVFLALRLQLRLASNIRDFVCVDDCRNGNSVFMGNARERYLQILAKRPEIIRHVSLKIIASYLGVTPNYLSNLRRSLATD